jgi:sugar phosphate permease
MSGAAGATAGPHPTMTQARTQPDPSPPAEPTAPPALFYGYWLIAAAFFAQFVAAGSQSYLIGAFLAPMTEELGWTRAAFTIPRSLAQFVMAFTGFLIGVQVDRYGGRRFMLAGAAVLSGSMLALGSVHSLAAWIALNGLALTIGSALIGNLVVNVTLSKWFVERRGRAIAWSSMGVSFGGIVLTPLATTLIDAFGWRAAWRMLAVGAALVTIPAALAMRRAPEDHGMHPDGRTSEEVAAGLAERAAADYAGSMTRAQALRTASFYLLVLAFGLFVVNIGVMLLHTIPFMTDAGYPRSTAAWMITLASIPSLVSKPIWGLLIDRSRPLPLAAASSLLTGLALIGIVLGVQARSIATASAAFFALGVGWGGMIPLQEVIWASFFGRRHLGAVRSAALPFSLVLGASAPLGASYYMDRVGNYDGAFLLVAAMNLLSGALLVTIRPPARRAAPPSA